MKCQGIVAADTPSFFTFDYKTQATEPREGYEDRVALCEGLGEGECPWWPLCDARPRARLDAAGDAQPKMRLLGHAPAGVCVGPGSVNADCLEDIGAYHRTPLFDLELLAKLRKV